MSKRYLRPSAETGTKIIKYWNEFYYRIDHIILNGVIVSNFSQLGFYEVKISWKFNSQEGFINTKFEKQVNGIIFNPSDTIMDTTANNFPLHIFNKTLSMYNDTSFKKALIKILNI